MVIVAAAPAGGGRSHCTPRFVRHFHVLCMQNAAEDDLRLIFESILGAFVETFSEGIRNLTRGIVTCILEV